MTGDPIVIGGTGGSGTRVVTRILSRAGWFMGSNLNNSDDTLDIARFDWQWGPALVRAGATEAARHDFEVALEAHLAERPHAGTPWGWKHPHSYLLLPFLAERFAGLRFVHVVRDGRDVALGPNHNQARLYGEDALGPGDPADPVRRIAFWAWANDRACADREALLPDHSICVRFEDLCREPEAATRRVLEWAGAPACDPLPVDEIEPPQTLGRARHADPALVRSMEAAAADTLRRFGYLDERERP